MRWRFLPFYLGLILVIWLLLWRLFDLTIVRGQYYRGLAEGNRVQEINIRAPRGIIYDRHGQVLARNTPVYKRQMAPARIATPARQLDSSLGGGQSVAGGDGNWQIVDREQALEIEANGGSEAAKLRLDLTREYPWGQLFAHAIGYTGEVNKDETQNSELRTQNYKPRISPRLERGLVAVSESAAFKMGDFIGRTGVEQQYESILRGTDGKELIEVDATGKKIDELGKINAIPGQNLNLTLDLDLQKVTAKEMEGKTGAVIVSNPQNGEILALYSSPSFDPNDLGNLGNLGALGGEPLFNRAISGLYPPGSTFKIITGAAGLETGKITKQTEIEDTGEINIGPYKFPNWYWLQYGSKEGQVDIIKAYKRSNDIFFYKVGEMVGIDKLEEWMSKFGLGKTLGIDLPGEVKGLVPTPKWRKELFGTDWYLGDTYHLAIGQGDLEVTPLQVNFWTNVIANGGKLCQPHLSNLGNLSNLPARNASRSEAVGCKDIGLKQETIDSIKEGMKEACEPGGTGWPLFNFELKMANGELRKIETACKTGTAEYGNPKNKTHAWFTVFAPASDPGDQSIKLDQVEPEISVTVLVEGGGEGSNVAAPIAKKILEEWFGR